jgi:hypothetical protein
MVSAFVVCYDDRIGGVLSRYDRVVVTGTLPTVCYATGMTRFLYASQIRIFDYSEFASTLRDRVREAAASLAAEAGITIEHVSKATSARKRSSPRSWSSAAIIPAWCMSSRRWKRATPTNPGTTSRRTRPTCGRTAA